MFLIKSTNIYEDWFDKLRDSFTQKRIAVRVRRITLGNFGDHKSVGGGVCELRMTFGPGYRIYYTIRDNMVVLLLCGGDKSSQIEDIKLAKEIAKSLENG